MSAGRASSSASSDDEVGRARAAAILSALTDAVLVVDTAGKPVFANAAFDGLLELDAGIETLQLRAARGECFSGNVELRTGEKQRWFEARTLPVRTQDGELHGGVLVLSERTDRRLLELHEEFMALASHELRSPLTALGGFFEMVARQLAPALDARGTQHVTRGRAQVRRLADLVNELTDLSRLHSGKLELRMRRLDLVPLVAQIVDAAQALSDTHSLRLHAPESPVRVNADPQRLEQVLMNLVGNAVKYAPDANRIDVHLEVSGDWALVRVQDHGPGVADGDREHIFQRYYQARRTSTSAQTGLGLGLHIAREIMLAHDGDLELTASSSDGSIFSARLPLAR